VNVTVAEVASVEPLWFVARTEYVVVPAVPFGGWYEAPVAFGISVPLTGVAPMYHWWLTAFVQFDCSVTEVPTVTDVV
jgi:hypothetical protein